MLVAVATSVLLGTVADAAPAARPHSAVVGVWETTDWERLSGEKLDDIPERLEAERWRISRARRCTPARCVLKVVTEALVGAPRPLKLELRPDRKHRYVGSLAFVSMCVDRDTRRVKEPHASDVTSTYRVRVVGSGATRELALTALWSGRPTPEGVAAGCEIRRARFASRARLMSRTAPK
jgi:hypothetical protein